jgi:iron complex outermembrane receptor protein
MSSSVLAPAYHRRGLSGAAAVLLLPFAVAAQGTAPRDTAAQRLEPTTVSGERGGIVIGGSSVMVVKLDSSRGIVSPNLAELMRSVPMMLVRTNSRGEVELSVRGSESRQVGIMMNGIPLSPGWDGRADPSLIPLTAISRVSYVRSTASVLGGPNTLGGIVDLSFDDPTAAGLRPTMALGTDHTGARRFTTTVASTRARDGSSLTWRVGGGIRQHDGLVRADGVSDPSGGEPELRTNTDLRQHDLLGSVAWRGSNGAAVSAMLTGYSARRGVAPELHITGPRYWRYPAQSRGLAQLRVVAPRLSSGFGTTELEAGGGVLKGIIHILTYADASYSPATGSEDGDEQVNTARFQVTQTLPGGAQVKAAVTGNNIMYDETLGTAPASYYRQDLLSSGIETNFLVGYATLVSGGFVVDRAVTLYAGGRPPLKAKGLAGWRVGATRQLTPVSRLHASASSRGRFPALRELYSGALNRFEPNPDLKPEHLLATELGYSYGDATAETGFNAQVTGFRHYLQDGIVRIGYLATNRFIRVNRDEMTTMGLEALVGWNGGDSKPSLTFDLVAQQVNIEDQTGGGAERKPEHMPNFRAMLDGTVPVGRGISLGANVSHLGSQYCVNPETDTDVNLAAQTLLGMTAHRSVSLGSGRGFSSMRILAGVDNIANKAIYEQCGIPRAGRTIRLGIELR